MYLLFVRSKSQRMFLLFACNPRIFLEVPLVILKFLFECQCMLRSYHVMIRSIQISAGKLVQSSMLLLQYLSDEEVL